MTAETKRKALSYVGFARRCGRCAIGAEQATSEVRKAAGTVCVVISSDSSERTRKQITDKCASYGAPLVDIGVSGEELGAAVGKMTAVSAVAVTDKELARAIVSVTDGEQLNERIFPHESGNR